MSPLLRKVKTASGATAVQIVVKEGRKNRIIEHLGSAHDEAGLAVLMAAGRAKLVPPDQQMLNFSAATPTQPAVVTGSSSALLVEVVRAAWKALGFDVVGDEAFFQLVLARLVEPTSMLDSARVLTELGIVPVHRARMHRCLARIARRGYRDQLAAACYGHATRDGDVTLVMYDVTTLHFEVEHEDKLRKVGYSKERRVDPQIIVGLLVDRHGFPLEIGSWEGNKTETHTIIPIINQSHDPTPARRSGGGRRRRHAVDDQPPNTSRGGIGFIVGSRPVKAPGDLAKHFRWHRGRVH